MPVETKKKKQEDEGEIFSKLQVQVKKSDHSVVELNLLIERAISQAEQNIKRLADVEKLKAAAQSDNRLAINEADHAAEKSAQAAIKAANAEIGTTKGDIKAGADTAKELGERMKNLRVKTLDLKPAIDDIETVVRALSSQVMRLNGTIIGMYGRIGKLTDLCTEPAALPRRQISANAE